LLEKSYAWKTWTFVKWTDGKIRNGNGDIIIRTKDDEKPIDFIIQNWKVKIWEWHSKISGWKNVNYAWEVVTDIDGNILEWRNASWHYKPNADDIVWKIEAIELFKEYIWIDITNLFKQK
jgi:hypothetical protein